MNPGHTCKRQTIIETQRSRATFANIPLELGQQILNEVLHNWYTKVHFWVVNGDDVSARFGIRSYVNELNGLTEVFREDLLPPLQRFFQVLRKESSEIDARLEQLVGECGEELSTLLTPYGGIPVQATPLPASTVSASEAHSALTQLLDIFRGPLVLRSDGTISNYETTMIRWITYLSTPSSQLGRRWYLSAILTRAQNIVDLVTQIDRMKQIRLGVMKATIALWEA